MRKLEICWVKIKLLDWRLACYFKLYVSVHFFFSCMYCTKQLLMNVLDCRSKRDQMWGCMWRTCLHSVSIMLTTWTESWPSGTKTVSISVYRYLNFKLYEHGQAKVNRLKIFRELLFKWCYTLRNLCIYMHSKWYHQKLWKFDSIQNNFINRTCWSHQYESPQL